MAIRDIENHLERSAARIERAKKIEVVLMKREARTKTIKVLVGIFAALCAGYAISIQF